MATSHMPDKFMEELEAHLPPEQRGGSARRPATRRARGGDEGALVCVGHGLPMGGRSHAELGCSGRTAHRRLRQWEELGIWDRLHMHLLKLLHKAGELDLHVVIIDSVIVRALGGGESTGPSPVDRRKLGSKHTLLVDQHGIPLAIRTAPANASDHTQILPIVLSFPKVSGKPGRPKEHPDVALADRGYDSDDTRRLLSWLGIEPLIACVERHTAAALAKSAGSLNGPLVG